MSDLFKDENQEILEEQSADVEIQQEIEEEKETSTVFADPVHREKKIVSPKRKRLTTIISAVLVVAVLCTGIWAAIKWIPTMEGGEDNTSSALPKVTVLDVDKSTVSTVAVKNKNGTFNLYSEDKQVTDDKGTTSTKKIWRVEPLEEKYTSSDRISQIVSYATSLTAIREIDTKTVEECGLDKPTLTVDVALKNGDKYSIFVGKESLDATGVYLKVSNSDKIYLVNLTVPLNFEFELINLANDSAFDAVTFKADVSDYLDESGTLTKFDYLKLSGANFPKTVTIEPNADDTMASIIAYIITSPENRYAADVDSVLGAFTNGIVASGAYSFDVSKESLAKVGLDKPDVIATLCVAGETKTYKIKVVDEEYCAVINEDSYMIKKVSLPNIAFASYTAEDLYSSWICMDSIMDMETLTITAKGKTHVFDIIHNEIEEGEDGDRYTIMYNGKKTDLKNFQEFYMYFVGIKCSNFTADNISAAPDATIKLTMFKGKTKTITFTAFNDTKYQVTSDGQILGKISSTYYNKFIKYLDMVIEGETISK